MHGRWNNIEVTQERLKRETARLAEQIEKNKADLDTRMGQLDRTMSRKLLGAEAESQSTIGRGDRRRTPSFGSSSKYLQPTAPDLQLSQGGDREQAMGDEAPPKFQHSAQWATQSGVPTHRGAKNVGILPNGAPQLHDRFAFESPPPFHKPCSHNNDSFQFPPRNKRPTDFGHIVRKSDSEGLRMSPVRYREAKRRKNGSSPSVIADLQSDIVDLQVRPCLLFSTSLCCTSCAERQGPCRISTTDLTSKLTRSHRIGRFLRKS